MSRAQKKLYSVIERVFEDGIVEPQERHELRTVYAEVGLNVAEAKAVFRTFVVQTWGEIIADGILTPGERTKLANIAGELRLPLDCVPPDVALVLALGLT